jgi:glycosyltransferase involved in cell wall biosynthesis
VEGRLEAQRVSDPTISVALVTRNRPGSLRRALVSLRSQSVQPSEVVVSDDSEGDDRAGTRRVALEFDCRYVEGPRRGLYANRNHTALACRGTHVRTMDDDHELPPDHFRHVAQAIRADPDAVWTIGQCGTGREATGEGFRCPPQLHPRGHSFWPQEDGRPIWAINDGATIYPRALFLAGHRLVEDFRFGAAYLEFGSRLRWLGYRIRHLDTTYVISHVDHGSSFDDPHKERASRLFAGVTHAFLYQPTARNRLLAAGQCAIEVVKGGGPAVRDAERAWRTYRRRREGG